MSLNVIVGAGAPAIATAKLLAERGEQVKLVSRRGTGPDHPSIERIRADATDTSTLAELAAGATTVFNCAMPAYDRWPTDFPPISSSLLAVAEHVGADYAMVGNAYGYEPPDVPVTEDHAIAPTTVKGRVRVAMWQEALAAHEAGRVRVTEVRGLDYIGAGAYSIYSLFVAVQLLACEPAVIPADLDALHTWTCTDDVGAALVAITRDERGWGRAWHVPSNPPVSIRDLTARFAEIAGIDSYELVAMTPEALTAAAAEDSFMAEVPEMQYMLRRPFILDSSYTEEVFGLVPTPLDHALEAMASALAVPAS
jgi:nucleoside-diphosphate-sugar epimerase